MRAGACPARHSPAALCVSFGVSSPINLDAGFAGETIANSVYAGGERAKSAMFALKQARQE